MSTATRSLARMLVPVLVALSAPGPSLPQTPKAPSARKLKSLTADACADANRKPDAKLAGSEPAVFGWLLFLVVNCPAQSGGLLWETWKPNYTVYLPGGQPPAPWGSLPPRVLLDQPEIDGKSLDDRSGQPVLFEIRMNQGAFDYIVSRTLYSKAGQLAFFNDPSAAPVQFPTSAIEIKAAWLILTPGDPRNSRYHTIQSSYVDPNGQSHEVLAGLASLHIISKVRPRWFWTTFEQVDNQERAPVQQRLPTSPDVAKLNDLIHADLPPDSVWRFYNMRGTQESFTNKDGSPTLLANTLLETRFQESSSCMTCHNIASRGSASEGRVAFFQSTPTGTSGFTGVPTDPKNKYQDAFNAPVCYDAGRAAFTDCKTPPTVVYKTLDYVWSMREAQ